MMRSSKARQTVTGAGVEAQALAARMLTLQADAGLTIAMRMPILLKGALGDSRGQREAAKAVTEKVSAVMESGMAAGQAAAMFWWGLALNPLAQVDFGEAAAKVANSTLEPFSKRTRANASRLTGRRR
jgi:MFS-type transporter involved in bile tolerance (Atg22 family)